MSSRRRGLISAAAVMLLAALSAAPPAFGQGGGPRTPDVAAEIAPVIGAGNTLPWGWNQILVRIQNNGARPARGEVDVATRQYASERVFRATAPYSVAAGASVHVRVPVRVAAYTDLQVRVIDEVDGQVASQDIGSSGQGSVLLLDTTPASRLRAAVNEAPIAPLFMPSRRAAPSSGALQLFVGQARVDPATGDVVLPDRPALYATADAVLMRTDTLARLVGAELDALAGYVLGGGTLALIPSRPEDLRNPTLVALAGGEVALTRVAQETLREILPTPSTGSMGASKSIPRAPNPTDEVAQVLAGWSGGNLRPSVYGSSAAYGLGEVHLLAFDPTSRPAIDDPWAQLRVIDLARRAYDRRSTVVFRPGDEDAGHDLNKVRQQLDPNESSRWAIGISALLLCLYAVLAGPINFSLAARKGKPLRALWHLPIYAAAAFALVVGIGIAAKGVTGRARHLTLVEAGAGMTKGAARRYRGFFASQIEDLTVRTTDASSVVSTAVAAETAARRDRLLVDRDGARLVDVAALPWQTVVVREDGFASLGEGIAILPEPGGGAAVVNRTGRSLRAVVLWLPSGDARYFARVRDGERVLSSAGVDLGTTVKGRSWISLAGAGRRVGGLDVHDLGAGLLSPIVEPDATGLGDAWWALEEAASEAIDWFPSGVPVLLGQLDGGEGRASDSGVRLESDRLLFRIVGFGGQP
jgi:hypothetical protein